MEILGFTIDKISSKYMGDLLLKGATKTGLWRYTMEKYSNRETTWKGN